MKKVLILYFIAIQLILLLTPSFIEAGTWEYITHNGYDSAVKAWTRVGLIFSDNNYKGLFISVIVLGALGIFIATYIRTVTGAKNNGISWAVPVLAGMAIYTAFILPKEKLIIYDEALNRGPQEINGIPLIVATSAGLLNKIEKGFIDIISTSADPASDYRLNAGGTGWQLIDPPLFRANLPMNVQDTIGEYIKNCVYMEILREGTTLTIDKIANGEMQFNEIIEQSKNPWWYTKEYITKSTGEPVTCTVAGTLIINTINDHITRNDGALNAGLKATCASRGFDVTNVASFNTCKSLILSSVQSVFPNQSDLGNVFRQMIMAEIMKYVVASDSPGVAMTLMATSQTTSQFIGLGVHANSWIPVLKESLTAVAISITPMILLFAATPLLGRALSLCLGMFVWLAMWGIIDAIIHAFGVDLAQQASAAIKTNQGELGISSMFAWPGYSAKVAATFGALRWSGLMLASVISGMLVKFGGTALAMLAGSISAMPQSSGAAYGSSLIRNTGGVLQSEVLPTQTWANTAAMMGGSGMLMRGLVQKQAGEMAGGARFGNELGMAKIAQATRGSLLGSAASGIGTGMAIDRHGFESLTSARFAEIASAIGSGMTKQEIANRFFGGDIAKAEYFMSRLEALRRYGVYDAYQKGIANEQDFIDFGVYFTKAQAGDVNAMKAIENITGKDFKDVQREIKQAGLEDSFQSAVVTAQIAQNLGIDRFSYFGQKHGLQNIALNEQMAQRLNQQMHLLGYKNFNAKAGDIASFSFDPSTGKFGLAHTKRGGASEFYDFKSALRGRQDVFKDLTVVEKGYREQSGTFVTRGVSVTQINEPYKYVGVYTAPDGTVMHGTFNYIKDKDGNLLIVSGSGSSTVEFSTYKTIELPNKFYGKDKYKVVDHSIYSGGGQPLSLLKSTQSGGESLILDRSKTFKGGYSFPGIWSMSAEQSGWEAGARILGAGESAFGSPGAIFVKKTFSANKKGGTKNP